MSKLPVFFLTILSIIGLSTSAFALECQVQKTFNYDDVPFLMEGQLQTDEDLTNATVLVELFAEGDTMEPRLAEESQTSSLELANEQQKIWRWGVVLGEGQDTLAFDQDGRTYPATVSLIDANNQTLCSSPVEITFTKYDAPELDDRSNCAHTPSRPAPVTPLLLLCLAVCLTLRAKRTAP